MILVLMQSGQMCNQLMTLVAAYAVALKYEDGLVCPIVEKKILRNFELDWSESPIWVRFFHTPFLNKLMIWFSLLSLHFHFHKWLIHGYRENKKGKLQVFFDAFEHKQDSAIINHLAECKRFFDFKSVTRNRCRRIIDSMRDADRVLVAVHARRGDYRKFRGGALYFDDEELMQVMHRLTITKKAKFVVFSNERINVDFFKKGGLDVVQSNGNDVEDLCCMSMCDCVMGPDSTYSWWAMVMGHIPRLILEKGHGPYHWADFKLYEDASYLRG